MTIIAPATPAEPPRRRADALRPPDWFIGLPHDPVLRRSLERIPAGQRPGVRLRAFELHTTSSSTDHSTLTDCWTRAITEARKCSLTS